MKGTGPFGIQSPWDIAAAVMAVLLYGNLALAALLGVAAPGWFFLEPAAAVATGLLLLLGVLCHLVTRRRTSRLWRRLLLGGIAGNFLIVAAFLMIAAIVLMSWQ